MPGNAFFLDSSYVIALALATDEHHRRAMELAISVEHWNDEVFPLDPGGTRMILPLLTCALLAPVAARGSERPTHGRAAVFGRVVGGWDTLAKIAKIPTATGAAPSAPCSLWGWRSSNERFPPRRSRRRGSV